MNTVAYSGRTNDWRSLLAAVTTRDRSLPWLLAGLGLVTRLYRVGANGLRTDEMYSVWMASRTVPDILRAIVLEGHDATPPTYYLLLHSLLQVSWELWSIRLVSILAGVALVWLTYMIARQLFDVRVAALSALLLAITPFSIEVSQVARAYALTAALTMASLYCFVRLQSAHTPARRVLAYVLFTLLALSTHYLVGVVVVVQNLIVLALFTLRRLARRHLLDWLKLQVVMGLLSLPLLWMALQRVPQDAGSTSGQGWLEQPSPAGIAKALILWATGDPSFGPSGLTVARLVSLLVVIALLGLGTLTAWHLWHTRPEQRAEVRRVAFVAALFFGTWSLALGVSFVRRIFHEKYFIYLAPLLLILLVWSALRLRPQWLGRGLIGALAGMVGLSLFVFYTSPNGEQWREALAYVNEQRQPGDYVVTAPGYYIRPVAYYLEGELPPADYGLVRAPFAVVVPGDLVAADYALDQRDLPDVDVAAAPAERAWLVTGYDEPVPAQLDWFFDEYAVVSERQFLGVRVVLGDRIEAPGATVGP